jgi:hypothetical protein
MHTYRIVALTAGLLATGAASAQTPPVLANTGAISAPNLVSAGMANVLVSVKAQSGASYAWSMTGGVVQGITGNAAMTFTAGPVGTIKVTCTVTVAGVATSYSQDVPVVAAVKPAASFYGSGFGADSLANTQVGGPNQNVVSYRFQARHASALSAIRVFFIWSLQKLGYQAGQGGTIQVDLKADDGSLAHLPTGPALATLTYGHILSQNNYYPKLAFAQPKALVGGAYYHLVFTNVDPTPVTEYISLDTLYTDAQTAPMQPAIADIAWAVLVKSGAGAWKPRYGFTPTLELDFADGGVQGNGYMEVWSTNPKVISGANGVRETFKVSGPSRHFTKVAVRVLRKAGSSPLTVRLEEANGTLIREGTVSGASLPLGVSDWVILTFPTDTVLSSGVAYNLTLSSPADTQYATYPIRKGADKGFSNYTYFPDGYAQFRTAGNPTWLGWDQWGTPNLKTGDLQFMFVP